MIERDAAELERVIERIKTQAAAGAFRVTQHAQQEMVEEEIGLDEVVETVGRAEILEHYPEHRRRACCLLNGITDQGRPLHVASCRLHRRAASANLDHSL